MPGTIPFLDYALARTPVIDELSNTGFIMVFDGGTFKKLPKTTFDKTFEDAAYILNFPVDFKKDYSKIIGVAGNINFTALNAGDGEDHELRIDKTATGPIVLTFGTGFTNVIIKACTGATYDSASTTAAALTAGAGSKYIIAIHFVDDIASVFIDQLISEDL